MEGQDTLKLVILSGNKGSVVVVGQTERERERERATG